MTIFFQDYNFYRRTSKDFQTLFTIMDKLNKVLQTLDAKEKKVVKDILIKIKNKDFKSLDVKKLKSKNNIFRVRKGKIRIIYHLKQKRIMILSIERRSEKTYKF